MLRDKARYGLFKANSNVGEVKIDISISGFGESFEVYKDNKMITWADSIDNEDDYYEDDKTLYIKSITIYKPFIRCLKRYR